MSSRRDSRKDSRKDRKDALKNAMFGGWFNAPVMADQPGVNVKPTNAVGGARKKAKKVTKKAHRKPVKKTGARRCVAARAVKTLCLVVMQWPVVRIAVKTPSLAVIKI